MPFDTDNYEYSVARIFNDKGKEVGTGFLVAPGYVLTCAHVVLSAIGLNTTQKYTDHPQKPDGQIRLDFPVLASSHTLSADVVEWEPYSLDRGDIAGLRLLDPVPDARIRPLRVRSIEECERDDVYSAYGFAESIGSESEAYQPDRARVAGERLRFRKKVDPSDDTIRKGFSGGPVFNRDRNCIVGMTAVVQNDPKDQEASGRAYVIPLESLRDVLDRLHARSLHDVIAASFATNDRAIAAAFQLCDVEDDPQSVDLLDRLRAITQLPNRGWTIDDRDVDRLTQFAACLTVFSKDKPEVYDRLKAWINARGINFSELYEQVDLQHVRSSVSVNPQSLMVEVARKHESDLTSKADDVEVTVSIWAIDAANYDRREPPKQITIETTLGQLADNIEKVILDRGWGAYTIHLFVPREWLDRAFDRDALDDDEELLTFGSSYRLVMRTNFNGIQRTREHDRIWIEKWQTLQQRYETCADQTFHDLDCSQKIMKTVKASQALVLRQLGGQTVGQLFERIAKRTSLPVAIWSRRDDLGDQIRAEVFDRECRVADLFDRLLELRKAAIDEDDDEDQLGYHLSLVWEDPNILPPTIQFDPEAC